MLRSNFDKFLMSILEEQFLNSSSIFASFFIVMTHNSSVNFGCLNSYFGLKDPIKVPNLRVSSALVKTCHIPHVIFETTSQFFFKSQIGWNFSWRVGSLKFCPLMGLFCPNHIKFQLKKVPSSYLSWHRRVNAKFKEKLTCGFKYNMSNLVNFHPTIKKPENFFLMGSFYLKYTRFELQKYREVIFHGTEQWCKIWINPDFVISKNDMKNWVKFHWSSQKSEKLYIYGLFLYKAYNVSARKFHRNYGSWQ